MLFLIVKRYVQINTFTYCLTVSTDLSVKDKFKIILLNKIRSLELLKLLPEIGK